MSTGAFFCMLSNLGRLFLRRILPKTRTTESRCLSGNLANVCERHMETSILLMRLSILSRSIRAVPAIRNERMQTLKPLFDVLLFQPFPYQGSYDRSAFRIQISK